MKLYTLLSIFGEGETGYKNAKFLLGALIIIAFLFAVVWLVKRLGIFIDVFYHQYDTDFKAIPLTDEQVRRNIKLTGRSIDVDRDVKIHRKRRMAEQYIELNERYRKK